jgi:hypothetical protein
MQENRSCEIREEPSKKYRPWQEKNGPEEPKAKKQITLDRTSNLDTMLSRVLIRLVSFQPLDPNSPEGIMPGSDENVFPQMRPFQPDIHHGGRLCVRRRKGRPAAGKAP